MIIDFSLEGKCIWISGASSGIGRACAIKASQLGAFVVLTARSEERLNETREALKDPKKAFVVPIELRETATMNSVVENVIQKTGAVHGVVNAAGISTTLPFRNITEAKLDEFFEVNVKASLLLTKQLCKAAHFSTAGGSIVFLTSVMAHAGDSGKVLYSMSKGALLAAARSLAVELAPRKIRVNCVSPGVVETPMTQNAVYNRDDESRARILAMHPLGPGSPEDVANACAFLLSDASRWVTGTQLMIDGGYTAR